MEHWTGEVRAQFGTLPVVDRLPRSAVYEITVATALANALHETGRLWLDDSRVERAFSRVQAYCAAQGFATLVWVYILCVSHENQSAVAHYGTISETDFLTGRLHRPWTEYGLGDELLAGVAAGSYDLFIRPDGSDREVRLTSQGRQLCRLAEEMLETSGMTEHRLQMLYTSQFDAYEDWDQVSAAIWPTFSEERRRLLVFADVRPGHRVLDVACGSGGITVEAGLYRAVRPRGHVVALDRSRSMVTRVEGKLRAVRARNVVVEQRDVFTVGELGRSLFDRVIGSAFMHYIPVDKRTSLLQILSHVTVSGGIISLMGPVRFSWNAPFFREWFAPVLALVNKYNQRDFLPESGEIAERMRQVGLGNIEIERVDAPMRFPDPHTVVRHMVGGVGFLQNVLVRLPWAAREQLLLDLEQRGDVVCARVPPEQRILQIPIERTRGVVP